MFHVVLFEPEIPPNTGNIMRLAANTGCTLHIVEPMGFTLDDKKLRRAGLDYSEWKEIQIHPHWDHLMQQQPQRLFAISTKGEHAISDIAFSPGDYLVFGPETRGLPDSILSAASTTACVRIPMMPGSRSMNLSNATAVVVYEAWRQQGFSGAC